MVVDSLKDREVSERPQHRMVCTSDGCHPQLVPASQCMRGRRAAAHLLLQPLVIHPLLAATPPRLPRSDRVTPPHPPSLPCRGRPSLLCWTGCLSGGATAASACSPALPSKHEPHKAPGSSRCLPCVGDQVITPPARRCPQRSSRRTAPRTGRCGCAPPSGGSRIPGPRAAWRRRHGRCCPGEIGRDPLAHCG